MIHGRDKSESHDDHDEGKTDEELDEAIEESFPASDPVPPPTHPGKPEERREKD